MTHEPTLVIMAAGMGSRFGGLKQMTPVDDEGHFIIDFSLYDVRLKRPSAKPSVRGWRNFSTLTMCFRN